MDKIKNMRAFQDGKRLVIVIEDADDAMLSLVKAMLAGSIPSVQHIAPPPDMVPPKVETETMKEIEPSPGGSLPKFIQSREPAFGAPDCIAIDEEMGKESSNNNRKIEENFYAENASYFEIKDFLSAHQEDKSLKDILYVMTKSRDLDFVLNVKSEKELREIARQLVARNQMYNE